MYKNKLIFILLVISIGLSAPQQSHKELVDPWLGFDKVQHFSFSCLITLSSQYMLVNKYKMEEKEAVYISAPLSLLVGISKEIGDKKKPKGFFSRRDLLADLLGIGVAMFLINMPSNS